MKKAKIYVDKQLAGTLVEVEPRKKYVFEYLDSYKGYPVSLEMPISKKTYAYNRFPPFFENLLPEGMMLEGFLRKSKIDKDDYMSQLIAVGKNLVGVTRVEEIK